MIDDARMKALQSELKATGTPAGIAYLVIAVDIDTGERTWFTTAGGPWVTELEHTASEYRRFCPEDCEAFPLDPVLPTTN